MSDWSLRSPGFATDLVLMEREGSTVEEHDDYVVLRTPSNPTYHWGNCLILRRAPDAGSLAGWLEVFRAEHPDAAHVAVGIDDPDARIDSAEASAAGVAVETDVVLTSSAMAAATGPEGYVLGLLDPDDEPSWAALVEMEMADEFHGTPDAHRLFLRRRYDGHRRAIRAGHGSWWAATTAEGVPAATLGVFGAGAGRARYQSVMTHPEHRRRGLAGALVRAAGRHALEHLGARSLVIVADPEGPAIGVYRRAGLADAQQQTALYRPGG